jgi:hypothetical protein
VSLSFALTRVAGNRWNVRATGSPVGGLVYPIKVSLQIGDVVGFAQITGPPR